jgi:oligopeptide/dipeptide ABC transporter ATP-binding protein
MNSLNPVLKVGDQVAEPMIVHHKVGKDDAYNNARALFKRVGVPEDFLSRYAFELSGGMRQRVAIAMSLITVPDLVILDEPTSALDVLTQANIMNLLKQIKKEIATSFLLITHDIATSSELADRVAVMYAGQIVEVSTNSEFFTKPLHPYSAALMSSVPRLRSNTDLDFIGGQPPSLINPPTGCRFAARCRLVHNRCVEEPPTFNVDGRQVKCWLYSN